MDLSQSLRLEAGRQERGPWRTTVSSARKTFSTEKELWPATQMPPGLPGPGARPQLPASRVKAVGPSVTARTEPPADWARLWAVA